MQGIGVWQVTGDGPKRVQTARVDFEQQLEQWIENDPGMIQAGLTVVGRQVQTAAGRVDLLGLDPQGTWTVIEIKRGLLERETLAQAVDYASCVASLPFAELAATINTYLRQKNLALESLLQERHLEESPESRDREVKILLVGTGITPGLERITGFLSQTDLSIELVSFQVFQLPDGQHVLVRHLSEREIQASQGVGRRSRTVHELCAEADQRGSGKEFRKILEAAQRHGLYPRPYTHSIMYTHPGNRNRMLLTVWVVGRDQGRIAAYVGPEAFAEFYGIPPEKTESLLGKGWQDWDAAQVADFVGKLERFFALVKQGEENS